jgi:putative ABC transport system substrate-binding protein
MSPRVFAVLCLLPTVLLPTGVVGAQQPKNVPRIGYLSGATPEGQSVRLEAFRHGLLKLGYLEGKNIFIEYRYAEGKLDRLPALATELVRLKVDVIVTGGAVITRSAKNATNAIPIVMTQDSDPVANGFVASLARPGGNITGLSNLSPEISGKQLELLKEIIPKLARVAVLGTAGTNPANAPEIERAGEAFKVKLQYLTVLSPKDIETAFQAAGEERADAIVVQPGPPSSILVDHRLSNLQLKAGSQRYIASHNTS